MNNKERLNNKKYWNAVFRINKNNKNQTDNWLDFYAEIIYHSKLPIIDLGCGCGYDTSYLLNKNKNVVACDLSENAINIIKQNFPNIYSCLCFDMTDGLPFSTNSADLIIADLSLHYFNKQETLKIIKEIKRVLVNKGHLIFRVNSNNNINYGDIHGTKIENNLYITNDKRLKRFFDEKSLKQFFNGFEFKNIKEETIEKYGLNKQLYNCCAINIK